MTLVKHYVLDEKVVKSVTGENVLNIQAANIEQVFHFPIFDKYYRISYENANRWYQENLGQDYDIV